MNESDKWDRLMADLIHTKMRLAAARKDTEQLKQCCESLHAILLERNCCTTEDYFDISQMVKEAMKGHSDERPV